MTKRTHWLILFMGSMVAALSGCGGDKGPPVYPVTGTVTFNGQPVKNATVQFSPVDNDGEKFASGIVDDNGKYSLTTGSSGRNGAQVGKYKVYITPMAKPAAEGEPPAGYGPKSAGGPSGGQAGSPGPPSETADLGIPQAWTQPATTPLEVEVKPESNTIDIEIK